MRLTHFQSRFAETITGLTLLSSLLLGVLAARATELTCPKPVALHSPLPSLPFPGLFPKVGAVRIVPIFRVLVAAMPATYADGVLHVIPTNFWRSHLRCTGHSDDILILAFTTFAWYLM